MTNMTTQSKKAINVAVFGSGSGSVLEALIHGEGRYKIKAIVTDRKCRCLEIGDRHHIPTLYHSFKNHMGSREEFDEKIVDSLSRYDIDIIFLAGYMRLIHRPLLKVYPNRILNVHPADLTIVDDCGKRKYVGMDGLADALKHGETATRSSVFVVDEGVDTGQIIALGPWVEYAGGWPITDKTLEEHRDKHKRLSDWIVSVESLNLVAEGRNICAESSPLLTNNR